MRILNVTLLLILVTAAAASTAMASFPGPNGKIVFEGDAARAGGGWLEFVNGDGSGLAAFGPKASSQQSDPAFSADGRFIAFSQSRDIWIAPADGSSPAVQ